MPLTDRHSWFEHHGMFSMKYFSKIVASVVLFAIGAMPLLASIPGCHPSPSTGCCAPSCPMMMKLPAGKAKATNVIVTAASACGKVCVTPDTPVAVQGTTKKTPNPDTRRNDCIDLHPRFAITRAANATSRREHTVHPPRASLCIFLI